MASRVYSLSITVPAGTAINSPISTTWPLEDNTLSTIDLTIPDGHNGYTGIRMLRSQQQVYPWGNNSYLTANGRSFTVSVNQELTESKLVILTYNTGFYDHTFYLQATITDLSASSTVTPGASLAVPQLDLSGIVLPSVTVAGS